MSVLKYGFFRVLAVFYIVAGGMMFLASTLTLNIARHDYRIEWTSDAWVPLWMIIASVGVLKTKLWGYWSCMVVSIVIGIYGAPYFTLFSVVMMFELYRFRHKYTW